MANDAVQNLVPPAEQVRRILAKPIPASWHPSTLSREFYLDLIEAIVRHAEPWVDAEGAVIDPVLHREYNQSSPRFASSCAVLLRFGRCREFREKLYRVMDYCCAALGHADSVNRSPDFWMRELSTAYFCLRTIAPEERLALWRRDLGRVIPEKNYKIVSPDPSILHTFHNWAIYSASGEVMREAFGIPGPEGELWGKRFFDEYVRHQLWRFNEYGMYRDPGDPITYDITTRLQLEAALAAGYDGIWRDGLRRILDDAMLATLLFLPPSGQVPFGGRSSQFYFQEGIVCALCELAAARYKERDPRLAGAFKRQAHLSALAVRPGLLRSDGKLFHIKNFFPVETHHGCDGYGHFSVYLLFAGSVFALAALFADDTVAEAPAVSESGGFAFALTDNFYKLFLNDGGSYLEFDLKPNPDHDACGLGRVLMKDLPWGLLPVLPFAQHPAYSFALGIAPNSSAAAIAPEWCDRTGTLRRLAEWDGESGQLRETAPGVRQVVFHAWDAEAVYTVVPHGEGRLELDLALSGDARDAALIVPVLKYDGENRPVTKLQASGFTSVMAGKKLTVTSDGDAAEWGGSATNRTGEYDLVRLPFRGETLSMELHTGPEAI